MKTWLLAIVFFNVAGEPLVLDGWHPRQHPTLEVCEERLMFLDKYLSENPEVLPLHIEDYEITCTEVTW